MRRFKITNNTNYRTGDLRRFLVRAAAMVFDPEERPVMYVSFGYSRHRMVSGYAYYNSASSHIRLRRGLDPEYHTNCRETLARVLVHEFGHNRGLKHRDMRCPLYHPWLPDTAGLFAWADTLPLRQKPSKAKAKPTAGTKLALAQAALLRWQTKRKRAETAIRKYKARVRYYERKAAASPPGKVDHDVGVSSPDVRSVSGSE